MTASLPQFEENLSRVSALIALHSVLANQTTPIIDLSDLLRACHVMAVSALDHYVHEVTRTGMMAIFDGARPSTATYWRFRLSMQCLAGADTVAATRSNVEADIRSQHSFLSFQHPDKIADALRTVTDVKLWDEVASLLGHSAKDVKDRLTLIVDRRNKIAHEADLDPTYPNTRWPIHAPDVTDTVGFLSDVVQAIDLLLG